MFQPKDRLAEWTQKQDPYICCLQETHFRSKDTYILKVRGSKNTLHANEKQQVTYKGKSILLTAELSAETLQARSEWQDISKLLKGKILQPRLLYWQGSHSKLMEK